MFEAEYCNPMLKPEREAARDALLEEASQISGRSASLIKEAVLRKSYPQYRSARLKREMPGIPPDVQKN
jgi:hypothetical protein